MKISELIQRLSDAKDKFGDHDVHVSVGVPPVYGYDDSNVDYHVGTEFLLSIFRDKNYYNGLPGKHNEDTVPIEIDFDKI